VLSIPRCGGGINGKCGQRLERIKGVPPGQRSEIVVIHRDAVPLSARHCDDSPAAYRSGPSRDWIKVKNPDSPAVLRARAGRC
jgi:hypothetical protein